MKTIRTKDFYRLKKISGDTNKLWEEIVELTIEESLPKLVGGLDHIDVKPLGIYVHDIGCNGRDNSYVIRRPSVESMTEEERESLRNRANFAREHRDNKSD